MDAAAIPLKPLTSWVNMTSLAQLQGFAIPEGGSGWKTPDHSNPQIENCKHARTTRAQEHRVSSRLSPPAQSSLRDTLHSRLTSDVRALRAGAFAAPARSPLVERWLRNYHDALVFGGLAYMQLESTRSALLAGPIDKYGGEYLLQHAAYSQARHEMPAAQVLWREGDLPTISP